MEGSGGGEGKVWETASGTSYFFLLPSLFTLFPPWFAIQSSSCARKLFLPANNTEYITTSPPVPPTTPSQVSLLHLLLLSILVFFRGRDKCVLSDSLLLQPPARQTFPTMESPHDIDPGATQPDKMRVLTRRKSSSRFYSPSSAAGGPLFPLHESFSSDDSTPELVDDDRPESVSSLDEDECQYHTSASELWDSFWQGGTKPGLVEDAAVFPFKGYPPPRRRSPSAPDVKRLGPSPFLVEAEEFRRNSETPSSYNLFPRPPQGIPRTISYANLPNFANPFPSSPTSPGGPLSLKCAAASKSTTYLPAPTAAPPSPPRPVTKRKPPPLPLHKTLERPTTPLRPSTATDPDAPVSPMSRPPPKPASPPKHTVSTTNLPYLNRPLPPIPTAPLTNPEPQPTSFFDDSDDEDGSPGFAARIRDKFAHKRAGSGGRGDVEEQLRRARAGTEGDVSAGRRNVLARMLRRSRA